MLSAMKPIYWIPVLALLSASWVEEGPTRTTGMITLTKASGQPVLLHAVHVYAVHEGSQRLGDTVLTRVLITGRAPVVVRQSVSEVVRMLAGDWLQLELAAARKPVFVDPSEICTVEASVLKNRGEREPFSEINFINGNRIRVRQSPTVMRNLLGMP